VYLSEKGRKLAPTLYEALKAAEVAWNSGAPKTKCVSEAERVVLAAIEKNRSENLGLKIRLDYIALNDSTSFDTIPDESCRTAEHTPVILSGALWIDKTRLIDNIILGDASKILAKKTRGSRES
jgi:pantoate--beta-alanine ligase